jgi:hypothetical protein
MISGALAADAFVGRLGQRDIPPRTRAVVRCTDHTLLARLADGQLRSVPFGERSPTSAAKSSTTASPASLCTTGLPSSPLHDGCGISRSSMCCASDAGYVGFLIVIPVSSGFVAGGHARTSRVVVDGVSTGGMEACASGNYRTATATTGPPGRSRPHDVPRPQHLSRGTSRAGAHGSRKRTG